MKKTLFFYPGLCIKRWLFLALIGIVFCMLGAIFIVSSLSHSNIMLELANIMGDFAKLPLVIIFPIIGLLMVGFGFYKAFNSLLKVTLPDSKDSILELLYQKNCLKKGPSIVALGGGTGLSTLLRGLKKYTEHITAIVSVADDGGSSGLLREEFGMLPPGDIRNCLVALADKESLLESLLQYRFSSGKLVGHNMGNLLLVALNDMTGELYQSIQKMSQVLAIRGQVLPVTLENIVLGAKFSDGSVVWGESAIPQQKKPIEDIFLNPADCVVLPEALKSIDEAEIIILGPGSLYTSVLPNLLVGGMKEALENSSAIKVYICNITTQQGETNGYTASRHVKTIVDLVGPIIDYVLVNTEEMSSEMQVRYKKEGSNLVKADIRQIEKMGIKVIAENFIREEYSVRHDSEKLAKILINFISWQRKKKKK